MQDQNVMDKLELVGSSLFDILDGLKFGGEESVAVSAARANIETAKRIITERIHNEENDHYKNCTAAEMPRLTKLVRQIIVEQMVENGAAYRFGVISQLGVRVHPTLLHNFAIAAGRDSTDGFQNMFVGSKEVFQRAIKNMKCFAVDNVISYRPGNQRAENRDRQEYFAAKESQCENRFARALAAA